LEVICILLETYFEFRCPDVSSIANSLETSILCLYNVNIVYAIICILRAQ
jgi:hypothetical protein